MLFFRLPSWPLQERAEESDQFRRRHVCGAAEKFTPNVSNRVQAFADISAG